MATFRDFLANFLSALDDACKRAESLHTAIASSAKNFYTTGEQLNGNIEGKGADAFFNIFALNNERCELLLAKLNDYYNASSSLSKGIEEVTQPYDDLRIYNPSQYDSAMNMSPYLDPHQVVRQLRDGFVAHANLDDILNQGLAELSIFEALNPTRNQLMDQIDAAFQPGIETAHKALQYVQAGGDNNDISHAQSELNKLQGQHDFQRQMVQDLVNNMQSQLQDWSFKLSLLIQTYISETNAAAKVDQITLADLIYEANLPQNANVDVFIQQLPNGGLLIIIKGGNADQIENSIRQYLQDYGYAGQNPPITIVGYGNGESVAQAIIKDAQTPGKHLPFKVANAIMVGSNLPDPTGIPANYFGYQTMPEDTKRPWWQLTGEQYTIMAVTLLLAIPTEGASIMWSGEEITGATILQAAGTLGADKIQEYAVAMGYNSAHPDLQSEADFLAQKLKNYRDYTNNISVSDDGGKTIMSIQDYYEKHSDGSGIPLNDSRLQKYYKGVVILPEEVGLNTTTLTNDAYLGTQFIPDPTGLSSQHQGISAPVRGNPSP